MQFITGPDIRRHNNPTNNDIAAISIREDIREDGAPPLHRDILVHPLLREK